MRKYRSLVAWQHAHEFALAVLKTTDSAYHPRSLAVFDQLRRAAVSVEANLVEGYALGTTAQFRRHIRIAIGSAAEAECLLRLCRETEYLEPAKVAELEKTADSLLATLFGLLKHVPPNRKPT